MHPLIGCSTIVRSQDANIHVPRETVLRAESLELDLLERCARHGDKMVPLTSTEFRLLAFLMRHRGAIMTRTIIFESVWGYHFDPTTNSVDVYIGRLRLRLAELGFDKAMLRAVRGSGYLFV